MSPTLPTVSDLKSWLKWLLPVLLVVVALYYAVGMGIAHKIDTDPEFGPGLVSPQQSRAVAVAARLILREVDDHKWVANDPIFNPSWALDNMPSFQTGIIASLAHFAGQMNALASEAGEDDLELSRAAGFLKYPGNIWKFDARSSWIPTASSEKQYRSAARNLIVFNERLAAGDAHFSRHPDVLIALLRQIIDDLDAAILRIDGHLGQNHWALTDFQADNVFYEVKGRVYALSLVAHELGWDFAQALSGAHAGDDWQTALAALRRAAQMDPLVVLAASEDAALLPNHLAAQGFRVLQARARLEKVIAALEPGDDRR